MVNRLADTNSTKVNFLKIDMDTQEGAERSKEYGVQYLPTMVFVNSDHSESNRIIGKSSESSVQKEIDKLK